MPALAAIFLSTLPIWFVAVMVYLRHSRRLPHRQLLRLFHREWRKQVRSIRRLPEHRP
jgi:hypothetical protein